MTERTDTDASAVTVGLARGMPGPFAHPPVASGPLAATDPVAVQAQSVESMALEVMAIEFVAVEMMANDKRRGGERGAGGEGTAVISKTAPKTKRPNLYRVLLLNDDYTPMEFVIHVLEKFFNKGKEDATRIMLHVHNHGIGECGVFTYEVAETKVTQVMDFARKHQHPLQCIMEKK